MFYTIYKITNQIDGKFYIGSHKTKDLNDNYMGSGKYLKHAQKKYGIENFKKEILFVFETPEEMYSKEAEIVNEDFLATENTYNLKVGGFGGWDYLNSTGLNTSSKTPEQLRKGALRYAEKLNNDPEFRAEHCSRTSDRFKKLHEAGLVKYDTFTGKKHTDEARKKISETRRKNKVGVGSGNSQFGTSWVWHELFGNKKVKRELIVEYLEQGWYKTYKPGYKP